MPAAPSGPSPCPSHPRRIVSIITGIDFNADGGAVQQRRPRRHGLPVTTQSAPHPTHPQVTTEILLLLLWLLLLLVLLLVLLSMLMLVVVVEVVLLARRSQSSEEVIFRNK